MKKRIAGVLISCLLIGTLSGTGLVSAQDTTDNTELPKAVKKINIEDTLDKGKVTVSWNYSEDNIEGFEVEVSTSNKFKEKDTLVLKVEACESDKYSVKFPVKDLTSDGGRLYARVRAVALQAVEEDSETRETTETTESTETRETTETTESTETSETTETTESTETSETTESTESTEETTVPVYSEYTTVKEPSTFVKINDTNFKGMTKLLKSGYDDKKKKYDKNKDGWLCPKEIKEITCLSNYVIKKVKNKYKVQSNKGKPQIAVTGFKGIEYLDSLEKIDINGYVNSKADLSKTKAKKVYFKWVDVKSFELNAPNARKIIVAGNENKRKCKLKTVDISKCKNACVVNLSGTYNSYIAPKLPKSGKKLQILELRNVSGSTLDINKYTKLLELGIYFCQTRTVKASKCKELRYAHFYISTGLKSVDLSKCKKLKGISVYICGSLTASKVKAPKGCVKKSKHNPWWRGTKTYKKEVTNKLYK